MVEKAARPADARVMTFLPSGMHDQLREIADTSRRSRHSLVLEGLNLVFEQRGKS